MSTTLPTETILGISSMATSAILDLDEHERDRLRRSLEREARAEPAARRRRGVWNVRRDAGGRVHWDVRPGISLRERYSWNAVPLSAKKSGVTRIVLLGSSSAASFGYWDHFSLARVIEQKLNAAAGHAAFEVVDLACVNALWAHSTEMLRQAVTLEPDLVIFYCGNNEAKSMLGRLEAGQLRDLPSAASALFSEALEMPERTAVLHRCLEELVDTLATETVSEARRLGVDTVFLIPEYNLKDWQGLERLPVNLSGAVLQRWWTLVNDGENALARQSAEAAQALFESAIELDGGLCQRSLFGRARALTALGAPEPEQARAQRAARDCGIGLFLRGTPQITQGIIETLRARLASLDAPFVDLPAVLGRAGGAACVGRSYFVDYCHLTAEGMDLAATELARVVFERSTKAASSDAQYASLTAAVHPQAREEALASWVAAIHNYHYGQSAELVRYWLRRSLELWPPIRQLYNFLAGTLCHPLREHYTIERFRSEGLFDLIGERYFFFLAKFFYHARFDRALAELIDEELREPRPPLQERAGGALQFLDGNLYSLFFMDMRRGFLTSDRTAPRGGWERLCLDVDASEPESIIEFPAATAEAAELLVECSAPSGNAGTCTLLLNGRHIASLELAAQWSRHRVAIPAGVLRAGLNELRFRWPHLSAVTDHAFPAQRRRYVAQYGHYPVAARIHKLKLTWDSER